MNDLDRPFIDFYNRYHIIPVAQDITDIEKHFQRRSALYRHCGLPVLMVKDRTVLEIGPGTGHNALYTNSLMPGEYVLVDGARESIQSLKKLFESSFKDLSNCRIIESTLEDLTLDQQFDIVLCEGAIPFQKQPSQFLKQVAGFVKPSGFLMITTADAVSYLSEILRRVMALLILDQEKKDLEMSERLNILRPVFAAHLSHLKGMSRPVDDWIYDNMLQPFLGRPFSIAQAIEALDSDFDVYGSSPHMFTDWRWYKDIHGQDWAYNRNGLEQFWQNVHNLVDYRYLFPAQETGPGVELAETCDLIFDLSIRLQSAGVTPSTLEQIIEQIKRIGKIISRFSAQTALSIAEFQDKATEYVCHGQVDFSDMKAFPEWFGRGQQYVSFIRRSEPIQKAG